METGLDFALGDMADAIRETTRRFASDRIAPLAARIDEGHREQDCERVPGEGHAQASALRSASASPSMIQTWRKCSTSWPTASRPRPARPLQIEMSVGRLRCRQRHHLLAGIGRHYDQIRDMLPFGDRRPDRPRIADFHSLDLGQHTGGDSDG